VTSDGKLSAHYENTIAITNEGVEILNFESNEVTNVDDDSRLGKVVHSKSEREGKRKILIIIGIIDDEYVYISDGDLRKIDRTKEKVKLNIYLLQMFWLKILEVLSYLMERSVILK